MQVKEKLQSAALLIVGLIGAFLILTSDKVKIDTYSLVISILVGLFLVYLYFLFVRNREE